MDGLRWQRITELFDQAAERPRSERRAFLKDVCGADDGLAIDVIALLEEEARADSDLKLDLSHVADQMLGYLPFPDEAGAFVGRELGPYRLGKLLGEGGMGAVYLATREDLRTSVAVKILRDAWMSPARRRRFELEQRTLAQLNHPGIARLYDAETFADGTPCFVMEYVDGVHLSEYCVQHRCSIKERLHLFRSVCQAVQYAHERAVIHRDLKPSNILVRRDGAVKLLDFGISKQLDEMHAPANQTRTELRLMTPMYAAPEQIQGRPVGVFTDVYALGVILYELLAGRVPFDLSGCTPADSERILREQEPRKPSLVRSAAGTESRSGWADLDVLCLTAMHKEPERRYRSVEALIRDLDHYLTGEALEARRDGWTYRGRKFLVRRRRTVTIAASAFILFLATVAFLTVRLALARNQAVAAAARAQRVQMLLLNLFKGGDQDAGPADGLRVVTVLDRGVQEAHALKSEPEVQAELLQTLGGIYRKLGKFDRADALMRSALEKRRALFGEQNSTVASTLVQLGLLRIDQAQLEQGERLVRQGLDIVARSRPRDTEAVTEATLALGKVLEARGSPEKAISVLEQVVEKRSAKPDSAEYAASVTELANANYYAGHYDVSTRLNERALFVNRHVFGDGHPYVAENLLNLGFDAMDRGQYKEAEAPLRKALSVIRNWYGEQHPETASYMSSLGQDLCYLGRLNEAESVQRKALVIYRRVYGPLHPRTAIALNEIGSVEDARDQLPEAEAHFQEAADIFRSLYGEQNERTATALANVATVYLERKQYERAERLLRKVVALETAALSPTHLSTGIAQIKLGRALVRQDRFREAEEHSLAGYRIVTQQASPSISWLKSARKDLAAIYEALGNPALAEHFRGELAAPPRESTSQRP